MKRRNTESTNEIYALLKASKSALSHDMIRSKLTSNADRATIYRILNRFCEDKLVHKVMGDDGKQYFAFCTNCQEKKHKHNHFHFRCTVCGKVECLTSEIEISLPENYVFQNFNASISGVCSECMNR
ncbi:transcriptional repressor [Flavobacterium sp. NRK F10]|uniref:Transcriptional regulator n=1 Tax=Flavobacterium sediminis TaxID=2201181 RepID=A0A2U8QXV1_9FLAO|nr:MULTISPECIES: transcriptional repressor [Flavobacterium]AWM14736.1 transcriptional regulator [Flavobacterium sediminis]MCO6175977.1 transcriptional repressor [Flavobacterium sp. NRK F10]